MPKAFLLFIVAAALLVGLSFTSMASDLEQEYLQVRKIALKDPRVKDAFEKADERLYEKILQIDPALQPIVDRERAGPAAPRATAVEHREAAAAPVPAHGAEHIVVKGETLTSIAGRYKVTVASLARTNHIADASKLKVGQKLVIPASGRSMETREAKEPQPTATPKPADDGNVIDWVKKNL